MLTCRRVFEGVFTPSDSSLRLGPRGLERRLGEILKTARVTTDLLSAWQVVTFAPVATTGQ
jgi:hypothetical protein